MTEEMLKELSVDLRKEVLLAQRYLPKLVRQSNKFVVRCQKTADKVTAKMGDGHPRHVVIAFTKEGPRLAISDSSKPHDHYDLGATLRAIDKTLLKPISGLPSYLPTKR